MVAASIAGAVHEREAMGRAGHHAGWRPTGFDHGPDPAEYFERLDGGSPEKRLRLAVLMNAIAEIQHGRPPAADEAARWVRGEIAAMDASFCFAAICETLDLDADRLAQAVLGAGGDPARARSALPRRQVQARRTYGLPRRYRPRARALSRPPASALAAD